MKTRCLAFLALAAVASLSAWAVDIDGRIGPAEYAFSQVLAKDIFTLHWRIEGDRIHLAMEALSKGWVSVGFDPGAVMARSDMLFGLVAEGGKTEAVDAWSTGTFGPHPPDVDQGGKGDLLAWAGSRAGDRVVFECTRLLDTKDKFDKVIVPGAEMKLIWATGRDLVFTSKHAKAGSAKLRFEVAK